MNGIGAAKGSATPADLARIRDLIDRSSLGTPGARQLQQRTSDEEVEMGGAKP